MKEESKDLIRESNDFRTQRKTWRLNGKSFYQELEYYKNLDSSQIDYKKKLKDLKNQGIVDDHYHIK